MLADTAGLLQAGDEDRTTALHAASENGHDELVRMLVRHRAARLASPPTAVSESVKVSMTENRMRTRATALE